MVAFDQSTLWVILLILVLGLIVPELFRRLRLPFVSILILLGALFGPSGLGYIKVNPILDFLGFLGAAFLMLMAGLDVQLKHFAAAKKRIFVMAAFNGIIPFLTGLMITRFFGYSWTASLLVGTIFISSSVAIVIASVTSAKIEKSDIGEAVVSSAVVMDIASLLLLAAILQNVSPLTSFSLPIYFLILLVSIFVLKKFLPPLAKAFFKHFRKKHIHKGNDEYEDQLHFVIAILIGALSLFSALGVHPIVAAFIVGLLLSDVMTSKIMHHKLHTIAYGLFVPVFFFLVGMKLDLSLFFSFNFHNLLMFAIIFGLVISKLLSGYVGARWVGFSKQNSWMFGVGSTAQLTTTLAVTYAVSALGILDQAIVSSVVVLSILTTIFSPIVLSYLSEGNASKAIKKFINPRHKKILDIKK